MRLLPWCLAAIHAVVFIGMLARKHVEPYPGPVKPGEFAFSSWHMSTSIMVAGRDLHHDDLAMVFFFVDLPVLLVLIGTSFALAPFSPNISPVTTSYVVAVLWLALGSAWWFGLGKLMARAFRRPSRGV